MHPDKRAHVRTCAPYTRTQARPHIRTRICVRTYVRFRPSTAAVAEWLGRRTLTLIMLTLRRAEGREFNPRPGQHSRMSFSSDQVTGTVFPHLNMPFFPNSKFI